MSFTVAALVFAGGAAAALLPGRLRAVRRSVAEIRADAVPPLVHRDPGCTLAAYGPTDARVAEWEADDCLPAADVWVAFYPPGSLGPCPETAASPGPLVDDRRAVEDLLTGVLRHVRAHTTR